MSKYKVQIMNTDGTSTWLNEEDTKERALLEFNKLNPQEYDRVYLQDPDGNPNFIFGPKKK